MSVRAFIFSCLLAFAVGQQPSTISYNNFHPGDLSAFQFNGDAYGSNGQLILTNSQGNQAGSAFLRAPVSLLNHSSFSSMFTFQMPNVGGIGDEDGTGADGIVFIVNTLSNVAGFSGFGMGYGGLGNSIGIEFDTYDNGYPTDINGNHVGIDFNGNVESINSIPYPSRLNDGTVRYGWADYNGATQTLEVRCSEQNNRPSAPTVSYTGDLSVILGSDEVYVGFSAATGSGWESHSVTQLAFTNTYAPIQTFLPQQPVVPICGNGYVEGSEECDGGDCCSSNCTFLTTVCRPSTGLCDAAETCTGSSAYCPADTFYSYGTVCRPSNGPCDVAETCSGSSVDCPADSFASDSSVCRPSAGVCDVAETCTGSSASCPADSFDDSTVVCRPSIGSCDVAETCSGSSASCPADSFASASSVCRPSAGVCDVADTCTGSSASCPSDAKASASTVCRPSAGSCDMAETCDGANNNCPADSFQSALTVCHSSTGVCDSNTNCTGTSPSCPNSYLPSTTVCRSSVGICDVAETCTGSSSTCPSDSFASTSTVCRPVNGTCDVAEYCTGSSSVCPIDAVSQAPSCQKASYVCPRLSAPESQSWFCDPSNSTVYYQCYSTVSNGINYNTYNTMKCASGTQCYCPYGVDCSCGGQRAPCTITPTSC